MPGDTDVPKGNVTSKYNFYSPTHLSVPIDQLPDIVDARYNTHNSAGRDQYIYYTSLKDNVTGKCKAIFSPCLLRDTPFILSIPGVFLLFALKYSSDVSKGSAVAVKRIFSAARDTISLRRASLKPETVRTLVSVKQRLHLAGGAIRDIIGD